MPHDPPKLIVIRKLLAGWMLHALAAGALLPEAGAAEYTLERVVLVSRHGVRAPTAPKDPSLADVAARPWPTWIVNAPADLTPRGEELASRMGDYYRQHFAARGALPVKGCPAENQIYVRADVDQRTRRTGDALLAGAFPACGLRALYRNPKDQPDPLFHPLRGACRIEKRDQPGIKTRIEQGLEAARKTQAYRDAVRNMQAVLGCCKPQVCNKPGTCTLENASTKVEVNDDGVHLKDPIAIGSTTSEIFLLEYAQGMPRDQVAWGLASTPDRIVPLLQLHAIQFDLINRMDYLARRQGSALVHQVLATLRQAARKEPGPMQPVPPDAKVVIYVGHDTNLANIGGMLNLHWRLKGYLPDETPPAGAMAFELLRRKEGSPDEYFVRMAYYSQTLDQMRNATRLSPASPPDRAGIAIHHLCGTARNDDGVCPWGDFDTNVGNLLDNECLAAK